MAGGRTLFIDARKLVTMIDRVHNEQTDKSKKLDRIIRDNLEDIGYGF